MYNIKISYTILAHDKSMNDYTFRRFFFYYYSGLRLYLNIMVIVITYIDKSKFNNLKKFTKIYQVDILCFINILT